VRSEAGEDAHVEGIDYEGDTVEGEPPVSNLELQDREVNNEGAPLKDRATRTSRDEGDEEG
jgi:hypothetical protein